MLPGSLSKGLPAPVFVLRGGPRSIRASCISALANSWFLLISTTRSVVAVAARFPAPGLCHGSMLVDAFGVAYFAPCIIGRARAISRLALDVGRPTQAVWSLFTSDLVIAVCGAGPVSSKQACFWPPCCATWSSPVACEVRFSSETG